jgi:hypothetical protein
MSKLLHASFGNPNGIQAVSPGLRGTSYPGFKEQTPSTLKGLYRVNAISFLWSGEVDATLSGLMNIGRQDTQGSSCLANPGLSDAIPSGLAVVAPN